jgi:hypothetical protein
VVNRCISTLNGSLSVRNLIPGMKCSGNGSGSLRVPIDSNRAVEID